MATFFTLTAPRTPQRDWILYREFDSCVPTPTESARVVDGVRAYYN